MALSLQSPTDISYPINLPSCPLKPRRATESESVSLAILFCASGYHLVEMLLSDSSIRSFLFFSYFPSTRNQIVHTFQSLLLLPAQANLTPKPRPPPLPPMSQLTGFAKAWLLPSDSTTVPITSDARAALPVARKIETVLSICPIFTSSYTAQQQAKQPKMLSN